ASFIFQDNKTTQELSVFKVISSYQERDNKVQYTSSILQIVPDMTIEEIVAENSNALPVIEVSENFSLFVLREPTKVFNIFGSQANLQIAFEAGLLASNNALGILSAFAMPFNNVSVLSLLPAPPSSANLYVYNPSKDFHTTK
ncbi:39619_t:CDS:2, partial [Gigaspora margarita]